MHLKQFTIGRFACKRQFAEAGWGSGLASVPVLPPRCSPLLAAPPWWCHHRPPQPRELLTNAKVSSTFLSLFFAQPHSCTSTEPPISMSRRNPRQESVGKHADPTHTLSISPSSYLLGDLLFFIYSQAGFITANAWGESSGGIKRPNSSTLHCSVLVWSSSKVKRHKGEERGKEGEKISLCFKYIYIYIETVESGNNFLGFM